MCRLLSLFLDSFFFVCGYPVVSGPSVSKIFFAHCTAFSFTYFVKGIYVLSKMISMRSKSLVCSTGLFASSSTNITIFITSFLLSLKVRQCSLPTLFFFFSIALPILNLLVFLVNFGISLIFTKNDLLGFYLGIYRIYRSTWKELTSWQYQVVLSINVGYLFIYFFNSINQSFAIFLI